MYSIVRNHTIIYHYVVEKGGHALFGRDWLKEIPLDWNSIKSLTAQKKETPKSSP
jgi:hypothetical protein